MRRALPALTLALALVLASAGCTDDDAPPPTTAAPTTTTTEVPLATAPELLDPGAEPRQALRLAYRPGDEVVLRIATDVAVEQEVAGRTQRLDSPPIVQLVRLTVAAAESGSTTLELAIDEVTVDGRDVDLSVEQVAELQAALDPLTGITGTIELDELGRATAVALDLPDDLPGAAAEAIAGLEGQLRQLTPALPEGEVGVGARWRSRVDARGLAGAGVDAELVQTVTLLALEEGRATYDATVEVLADPQAIELADGTEGELVAVSIAGRSTGWFEVSSPRQEAEVRTEGTATLTAADGAEAIDQRTVTVVRVASQAP